MIVVIAFTIGVVFAILDQAGKFDKLTSRWED